MILVSWLFLVLVFCSGTPLHSLSTASMIAGVHSATWPDAGFPVAVWIASVICWRVGMCGPFLVVLCALVAHQSTRATVGRVNLRELGTGGVTLRLSLRWCLR